MEEMNELKLDKIKSMVEFKLRTGQTLGHEKPAWKNIINKKIQYTIISGEFKLSNVC